ncbi:MAG: glycerate kinase [Chloroflexus sp.]
MRIIIAPSGFKESLSAEEVATAIAQGVRRASPTAKIIELPLVDGGEGFSKTLVNITGGSLYPVTVTGPVGQPVDAHIGLLGGSGPRTAVLEMAAAAGLRLVPRDQRNPLVTTTYGVGELIKAALDLDVERILVGCGDSGTNDGGAGMVEALGGRLLRADGTPIARGGIGLLELARIDLSNLDPRLHRVQIDVACNMHNILCGPRGVAYVFGPQKGATNAQINTLATALERYAAIIKRDLGIDVRLMPGGGASGGLGAGLHAFLGARLHNRYAIVMEYLDLDRVLMKADLVITAEGCLDGQTPYGKIPAEVGRRAQEYRVPVIALSGTIGRDADVNHQHGIIAYTSILPRPMTLDEAIRDAAELVAAQAEQVMRMILIGRQMVSRSRVSQHHLQMVG